MSQPIHVDLISDDDEDGYAAIFASPVSRRPNTTSSQNPTIVIVDDDPTPQKSKASTSTPSYVPKTPLSQLLKRDEVSMLNCVADISRNPISGTSTSSDSKFGGAGNSEMYSQPIYVEDVDPSNGLPIKKMSSAESFGASGSRGVWNRLKKGKVTKMVVKEIKRIGKFIGKAFVRTTRDGPKGNPKVGYNEHGQDADPNKHKV